LFGPRIQIRQRSRRTAGGPRHHRQGDGRCGFPSSRPSRQGAESVNLQIGVSPFGESRGGVLDLARRAAEAGLDGLILGDGFVSTTSFPIWSGGVDCFVELSWLAGQVDMPTYGIDAIVAAARDPRVLAKQA